MVGPDAGVAKLATLSDGTVFKPVNSFQKNQKKLATLQRQLIRKVKFSNNWQKQKRKIQQLHFRIANIRRDYLHKVTTAISKNYSMSRQNRFYTVRYWIRPDMKCVASLGTSNSGDFSGIHQPTLLVLWPYSERKPRVTESIRVSGVWIYSERRYSTALATF